VTLPLAPALPAPSRQVAGKQDQGLCPNDAGLEVQMALGGGGRQCEVQPLLQNAMLDLSKENCVLKMELQRSDQQVSLARFNILPSCAACVRAALHRGKLARDRLNHAHVS
jgi:hypothetical protein